MSTVAMNANQCKGTTCLVNDSYNADLPHSIFCQFEHFCAVQGLPTDRVVSNERFASMETERAWRAFTWFCPDQPIWPA